jgi:hypothetical protein
MLASSIDRVLEGDRERADRPIHFLLRESEDRMSRAATQIRRHLNIGDQSLPHRIAQSRAEIVDDLSLATRVPPHLLSGRDLPIPVRIDANLAISGAASLVGNTPGVVIELRAGARNDVRLMSSPMASCSR